MRGLKASEDSARYSKFAGLTLACVYVDQAEELPEDFYRALQARLSQPGFPQRLIVTPNPPGTGHWLEQEFPEDNSAPGRTYIRTTVYDNRQVLGEDYIQALEAAYPTPAQKRFFIHGRRGLSILGEAVYAKVFDRTRHVREVDMNPQLPLLEAWDFGQHHPAVLWAQLVNGQLRLLGELMGRDQFLEDFAHQALGVRAMLFPQPLDVWTCCDPAYADRNSQGLSKNAVQVLQESGVNARWVPGANHPASRDHAIQRVAQHMLLHERFVVHPRCQVLIDGLQAGYVWDDQGLLGLTKIIITTLGEKGSLISTPAFDVSVPSAKVHDVVDPTGAGDAYRAGLLKGIVSGRDIETSAKMGTVAASFAIERYGTQEHHHAYEDFLARYKTNFGEL